MNEFAPRLAQDEALARLTGEARDRRWPNVRPKDAATLILVDASGPAPRVLLGRRHPGHRFMPDRFVFPGGAIALEDGRVPLAKPLAAEEETRLGAGVVRPRRKLGAMLALAAIRETFEETGLMLGQRGAWTEPPPEGWRAFADAALLPDPGALRFVARAITPPRRPKRFDTRFFLAPAGAIAHRIEGMVGPESELVELTWASAEEAARLPMAAITRVILDETLASLSDGSAAVPFYRERHGRFERGLIG